MSVPIILDDYDRNDDVRKSIEFAYSEIRLRVANGGRGWREYHEDGKTRQQASYAEDGA